MLTLEIAGMVTERRVSRRALGGLPGAPKCYYQIDCRPCLSTSKADDFVGLFSGPGLRGACWRAL